MHLLQYWFICCRIHTAITTVQATQDDLSDKAAELEEQQADTNTLNTDLHNSRQELQRLTGEHAAIRSDRNCISQQLAFVNAQCSAMSRQLAFSQWHTRLSSSTASHSTSSCSTR